MTNEAQRLLQDRYLRDRRLRVEGGNIVIFSTWAIWEGRDPVTITRIPIPEDMTPDEALSRAEHITGGRVSP